MFKVVIADDEIYVVALIQKLIPWDKYQMTVEATANDGVAALRLVREIKPDLVIVDVRMPGYDGIAFMDEVRKFNTNVKFIVISGHKQFDYAKGALRNNVEDYLLKPISKIELESVISHVYDKLMETRQKEIWLRDMEMELDTSKQRIRAGLAEKFLKGEIVAGEGSLNELNEKYLTNFVPGCYCMAVLILDTPSSGCELSGENNLFLEEAAASIQKELQNFCAEILNCSRQKMMFFLLNYPEGEREDIVSALRAQLQKCTEQVKKFEGLTFRICMGEEGTGLSDAEKMTNTMWKAIQARIALRGGKLICPENLKESEEVLPVILEFGEEMFERALSELNLEELGRCIREMYSRAFYGIEEDSLLYYRLFMRLAGKAFRYFSDIGICRMSEEEYRDKMFRSFIYASGAREYVMVIYQEIAQMIEENQLTARNQIIPTIRIIKRYIAEHYTEDISLSSAAELVSLSPVYLSRLFKKEEGINFLDYLNQYRIEVSKKLLQDMRYNVLEAARMSGFNNTRYFSKIFKKTVGITPSEYRKRHLG